MSTRIISRRKFLGTTAAAAAVSFVPFKYSFASSSKKPNSKVNGVQLGITTYSYRAISHSLEEVLEYTLKAGVNALEMRSVLEEGLGIPAGPARAPRGAELTDKQKAETCQSRRCGKRGTAQVAFVAAHAKVCRYPQDVQRRRG